MLPRFLIAALLDAAVMAAAVIWMIKRPGPVSTTVGPIVCVGGIVLIMSAAMRLLWSPMLADFPPREPAPDAVRRSFQSFGLGIVNMGLSVHVAADEECLHLQPLPVLRWLGARPASIPWSAMKPVGRSGRVVRVAGHRLDGPKWCMELAATRSTD